MTSRYREVYESWRRDPEGFGLGVAAGDRLAEALATGVSTRTSASTAAGSPARVQHLLNCVDRHAAKRPDATAIIYDSPVTGAKRRISYAELLSRGAGARRGLADHGVEKGDRVILYLPMVPEAAIAMLACARLGAVHSVVFGGFAAPELATRIDDARRSSSSPRPAASSRAASSPTSRCSTRQSRAQSTSRRPASSCSATRSAAP